LISTLNTEFSRKTLHYGIGQSRFPVYRGSVLGRFYCINFEAITNSMQKYFYSYNIIIIYMF